MAETYQQIATDALARIEAREPALRAYAHLDRQAVLAEAERLDTLNLRGPLTGHAVAVKDIFDTVDFPTECGSPIHVGRRPSRDSAAVAAVRAAGGLVIGKSVTTEFAHMTPGPTVNPHDAAHTPGGSSSGSAATVAAGGASLALGTQTAGSVIRPAAFCGVVGFKPSFGLLSRSGLALFAESLDTVGGFARTVSDAGLLIGAMAGRSDLIAAQALERAPRIGLYRTPDQAQAETQALDALDAAGAAAARAGATLVELPDAPPGALPWADLQAAHQTVMAHDGARALLPERQRHGDLLSPGLRAYLDAGINVDGEARLTALRVAERGRAALAEAMRDLDVILTLSAPGEPPRREQGTGNPHFNRVWTLLGVPCLHLPVGTGAAGLPLGVQAIAPIHGDRRLMEASLWIERALES